MLSHCIPLSFSVAMDHLKFQCFNMCLNPYAVRKTCVRSLWCPCPVINANWVNMLTERFLLDVLGSAIGFTAFTILLCSWALIFAIGGESLFGNTWNQLVMYNLADKWGLTGWDQEDGVLLQGYLYPVLRHFDDSSDKYLIHVHSEITILGKAFLIIHSDLIILKPMVV